MDGDKIIEKIMEKKEFSKLPLKDVKMAFYCFDKKEYLDEEKIKFTRDLLRKVFSAFISQKLLNFKNKNVDWVLKKHLSTSERKDSYELIYKKLLYGFDKKISVVDLGAGLNGFSYGFFQKVGFEINYLAVEAMGQFVEAMNNYFKKENFTAQAIHSSLFELEDIKKIIKSKKKPKIVFLFKTIDSLEMLKRNYSQELLLNIVPLVERVVVSFATKSLIKKTKFKVKRNWILKFIKKNFILLDDFELAEERFIVFCKK